MMYGIEIDAVLLVSEQESVAGWQKQLNHHIHDSSVMGSGAVSCLLVDCVLVERMTEMLIEGRLILADRKCNDSQHYVLYIKTTTE